ncbi:GDP-mannose 4,6-dehydratase [Campylobacter sp. TTU-622]|uniref:GDP-mannose 4,6-dehydratase n=1 Tax=unclassified Campylobacter TaxID=2593542 RepID=UPI0019042386|nr:MULTISPECIES: GDP-mannose 4,6-dehydratase [unclassified Campylobacter]MBK1973857.1 GDP-mannose 4,6-dehydratase [Campylobacter sp. TTU-622]MBK1992409.1 GDP-mannose 4,6-dehydratase [Campylobacter sp. 2018MI34]
MDENILVTGADGFIGSHLCESLVLKGFKVKALVQYNSFNSYGHLEKSPYLKEMEIISGDLRDSFFCEKLVQDVNIIFHLGALIAIPYSYMAPKSYVDTNIGGTLNLLEAAKKSDIKLFIHTSTSEVYGSALYVPIDEKHPLQPQSPYSASKIAADMMALSYYHSFNLPLIIARPFNTYGPRQSARAIIPTIITQILNKEKELKLGDLTPTRDLNFVLDTCEGFISLLKLKNYGEVFNIGSSKEYSMQEVVMLIKKLLNSDIKIIQDKQRLRPKNSEVLRLCCDSSKLFNATGWKSKISLEEGLQKSIDYFKENLSSYKSNIYNV